MASIRNCCTRFYKEKKRHVITTLTEHKCVLDSCRHLETEGFDVTYLPVSSGGASFSHSTLSLNFVGMAALPRVATQASSILTNSKLPFVPIP